MTEEINNGTDIQPSDNITVDISDSPELHPASSLDAKRLDGPDLGASKPVPQPQPKQRPLQHPVVIACGHTLDVQHFPTMANCEDCWMAFFEVNVQGLASVHSLLTTGGPEAVTAVHGRKFTKFLGKYFKRKMLEQVKPEAPSAEPSIEGSILDIKTERTENAQNV
jgi:hypothetical protein